MSSWNGIKRTPIRKKRKGTRRGQATPEEVTAIRDKRYEMAGGRCELNNVPDCIKGVLAKSGPTPWSHGHLVHLKAKRRHGTKLEDCRWGCWPCHLVGLHVQGGAGKIIPPKR